MGATILKVLALALLVAALGRGSPGTHAIAKPATVASTPNAAHPEGNLIAVVPAVPPTRSLRGLCTLLLTEVRHGQDPGSGDHHSRTTALILELIKVTGGTLGATSVWCESYLQFHAHRSAHNSASPPVSDQLWDVLPGLRGNG
jgi:hypothetical protein